MAPSRFEIGKAMGWEYEEGEQPCDSFNPDGEAGGLYNHHECPGCTGIRRFCSNCFRDHHAGGWDKCEAKKMTEPKYLILSTKHGFVGNAVTFWRVDSCGYTCNVEDAGRYSEEKAERICGPSDGEAVMLREDLVLEFQKSYLHADLRATVARLTKEGAPATAGARAKQWAMSTDTGISSMTIFHAFMGTLWTMAFSPSTPHDPDDFGRCYRLLEAVPEWRSRLQEVATRFPAWQPFVRQWRTMEMLYERDYESGESKELFELMKVLEAEGHKAEELAEKEGLR